jgi:hypothetical protein
MERGRKASNLCILAFNGIEDGFEGLIAVAAVEPRLFVVLESVVKSFRAVIVRKAKWLMQAF